MKKVLSIFMAILMVVTMFSFSTVAFAEEGAEPEAKPTVNRFLGTATVKNYAAGKGVGETVARPWNLHVFNPETVVNANTGATVGTVVIDAVNALAASGEYSAVNIKSTAGAEEAAKFVGLKGTADCPIVIVSQDTAQPKSFNNNTTTDAAITLTDCEYVTVESINVSALSKGVAVENCSNVTIKNVTFSAIGYVDYITPEVDEAGNETIASMDTTSILEKGSSVLVGANCANVTVDSCSFTKCRAGVVVYCANLAEGEVKATDISVVGCNFEDITDVAVLVNNAGNVVVSGGSVTKSGSLANAADYDGTIAADFMVVDAGNVTIEKVYSTDNNAFIYAANSTGRVRYNVSDRDGYSKVDAAELLIYNNTFVAADSLDLTATVKNNIFDMNIGEKVNVSNGEANCYHWTSKGDGKSIRNNPQFANAYDGSVEGTSLRDNYLLSTESPCLGEGVKVEDDMGTTDFYGNEIGSSYNIGADQGAGVEATRELTSQFVDWFNYVIALITNFFANLFG